MSAEENLRTYFRTIWKDTEGVVYLPSRGEQPKDWKQTLFHWPAQEDKIVQMVQARQVDREVYVNPVLYKAIIPGDDGKPSKATLARGNVLGSWVLWADFDGNAPENWPDNADIPSPTMRIRSSSPTNQHTYWQLSEFLTDPTAIEDKNRALAHQLHADISGWDVSQLLRPATTINHGYGKDERHGRKFEVSIEESSDRAYAPSFVQRESIYRPKVLAAELIAADKPSIRSVLAEGRWSKDFLNLFEKDAPPDRSGALAACAYYAAEAGFNDAAIYAVLDDADSRWGKYRDRTDRVRRLIDLVDRARRKYPYGVQDTDFGDLFGDVTSPVEDAPQIVFNFEEFMEAEVHVEWQLENLVPRKGYGLIYGKPGVGKTLLGMTLADSLVFGQNWLMWENACGPQRVLFLSLEMNHATLKLQYEKMVASFSAAQKLEMKERLHIAPLAESIPVDTQEGRVFLEGLVIQFKPDVLLIDSLSELCDKSLNDDDSAKGISKFLKYLRNKYDVTIIIVHHDRKSGVTKHADLDSVYGSRFITSPTDFILFLENTEPESDQIVCITDKNRLGTKLPPFLIHRDWADFSFTLNGYTSDDNPTERREDKLYNAISRGSTKRRSGTVDLKDSFDLINGLD
jgi:archaellum biogenesis ATPase FlaH